MEKCLFGKIELKLPELLVEDEDIFMEVVNPASWDYLVSDGDKQRLMNLLPTTCQNDHKEQQVTLKKLFEGENFKFGNPLHLFHKRLREGQFSPSIAKYTAMIKKLKYKDYQKRIRLYYSTLLKEILVNRQRMLDLVQQFPSGEPMKVSWWHTSKSNDVADQLMELRVCKKYRKSIKEVNEEFGNSGTSSEEEDLYTEYSRNPELSATLLAADDYTPSVFGTFEGKPVLANGTTSARPKKKTAGPVYMSENDFKSMLKKHKRKRDDDSDDPEMETGGITLDDIIARTYGKPLPKSGKEKAPRKKSEKKSKKMKLAGSMPALWSHDGEIPYDDNAMDSSDLRDDVEEEAEFTQQIANMKKEYGEHANFFSLIRDLICEESEQKITTFKLEQKVGEWQRTQCARQNHWFPDDNTWYRLASPALNFLSGEPVGEPLENFVPFVDYKERPQLWKWIGQTRDSDGELQLLYMHWLKNKEEVDFGVNGASTPPPRIYTDYKLKDPSDEDLEVFREQETMRFENPQLPFTYYMHGYESVVGPVKGVYEKPDTNVKARDHILLVKDRPSFVTILTLVRDSAARLPNGEGTRNEICELLKYSQYLAPGISDSQHNNVVSGALDRLHYEKDPCCKYDTNRKMWVYLHRNRSEEEFEKIHQTQGAVAKAKKSLSKPKASKNTILGKKTRDTPMTTQPVVSSVLQPGLNLGGAVSLLPVGSHSLLNQESQYRPQLSMSPKIQGITPRGTPIQSPRTPPVAQINPRGIQLLKTSSGVTIVSQALSAPSSSISGLDILSSVAQTKMGGDQMRSVTAVVSQSQPPSVMTQVITRPAQGQTKMVSLAKQPQSQHVSSPGSPSILASHLLSGALGSSQIPFGAKLVQSGSKPVAFSLLQSPHDGGKSPQIKQIQTGIPGQTKTVVLTSKAGVSGQQFVATLKQAGQSTQEKTILSPPQDLLAAKQQQVQSPGLSTSAAGTKPVLARLISQGGGQQVITLSGGQRVVTSTIRMPQGSVASQPTTIQSSQKSAKPLILQRAGSVDTAKTTSPVTPQSPNIAGQVARLVQQSSGKPATLMITKPGTSIGKPGSIGVTAATNIIQHPGGIQATIGGKPIIIGGKHVQIGGKPINIAGKPLQIGGKPVQISGKPIQISGGKPVLGEGQQVHIGGKPIHQSVQIGGKPVHIGGKPVQIGGKPMQIGGKPVQIGGKPMQIGGKPVQFGGKPMQIGGKPVQFIQSQVQAAGLQTQTSSITTISTTQAGLRYSTSQPITQTMSSSLVNQLLQAGAIKTNTPGVTQVRLQGQPGGVMTVSKPGMSTTPAGSKVITVTQGSMMGQQIVLQSSQGGAKFVTAQPGTKIMTAQGGTRIMTAPGGPKVVAGQQQIISAGRGKPTILATGGAKPGQNIQLVRTVVSQAGGKPGTTILLTQPSGQTGAVATGTSQLSQVVTGTNQLSQGTLQSLVSQGGIAQGRGGAVYAQIVSPQGVRYTTVRPQGQVIQGQVLQGQGQGQVTQGLTIIRGPSTNQTNTRPS